MHWGRSLLIIVLPPPAGGECLSAVVPPDNMVYFCSWVKGTELHFWSTFYHSEVCPLTRLSSILIRDSNSSSPTFHLCWLFMLTEPAEATSCTLALYFSWSSTIRLSTPPAHEMAFTYNHKVGTEGRHMWASTDDWWLMQCTKGHFFLLYWTSVVLDHPPKTKTSRNKRPDHFPKWDPPPPQQQHNIQQGTQQTCLRGFIYRN